MDVEREVAKRCYVNVINKDGCISVYELNKEFEKLNIESLEKLQEYFVKHNKWTDPETISGPCGYFTPTCIEFTIGDNGDKSSKKFFELEGPF